MLFYCFLPYVARIVYAFHIYNRNTPNIYIGLKSFLKQHPIFMHLCFPIYLYCLNRILDLKASINIPRSSQDNYPSNNLIGNFGICFSYGLKFIYSKMATKFCEIFNLLLTVCTVVRSSVGPKAEALRP